VISPIVAQRIQRVTLALAQAMIFNELLDRSGERTTIVAVAILVWLVDNISRDNLWYIKLEVELEKLLYKLCSQRLLYSLIT